MTDRDDALIAKSAQVEQEALEALDRRRCDRRGVGEKFECPKCLHLISRVCRDASMEEVGYIRYRQCVKCSFVYRTIERLE